MPKKRTTPRPHGKNLIADRIKFLREGGDLKTGKFVGQALTQEQLADKVSRAIEHLLPSDAPLKQRQRRKERDDKGDVPFFRREDISKIEAGTRHVRDYELVALADVFDVGMDDLTARKEREQ